MSCVEQQHPAEMDSVPDPLDLAHAAAEVEEAVWRFHAADTAMDADAVVEMLWPDFYMLVDGSRMTYQEVVSGTYDFMGQLGAFNTIWSDLQIKPLSHRQVISSFVFRDSIVTKDGQLIQSRGPTTLVWTERGGEWRIVYADADHYPIDE